MLCYYVSLRSEFRVVMSVTMSVSKRCSVRLCLHVLVGGLMSYLHCLWLLACGDVRHVLCCGFFFRIVCPELPVSLDCLFLIAPSVLCNVYLFFSVT